jgi:tetratricopeptide (TPR) repeat protein
VRLDRAAARQDGGAHGGVLDLRRRIYRLEVARGRAEAGADDAGLLADVDRAGDITLRCEARMALAGVASEGRAAELIDEAVELSLDCGPAVEFAARVLRSELCYSRSKRDLGTAEADLRRALAIVHATSSVWQEVHIEGDLATLEAERGQVSAAIERFQRLGERAETLGMRSQLRIFSQNLAALLLREGRAAEAAETALRTAELAAEAGDPVLRAISLSLRAEALRRAGDLDAALSSASEAEALQQKRGDRRRALTLLRRAEILSDLLRDDEAERDAAEARRIARSHEDIDLALRAELWEMLHVVRRGGGGADLARVVAEASGSGITLRAPTRALLDQAQQWLAAAEARR